MKYKAIELIQKEFERRKYPYSLEEDGCSSDLLTKFTVKNGPSVSVRYTSMDNNNGVYIQLDRLVENVADDKIDKILRVINKCHLRRRYAIYRLDEDRNVNVSFDFPPSITDDSVGPAAWEIFYYMYEAVNETYPMFMKVIRS